MLDGRRPNMVATLATPQADAVLAREARKGTVIDSKTVTHNFAWMRPNDLVYSYVVNDWLLGNDAPAFDVLAWNDDATNLSATFSLESNALLAGGKVVEPGGVSFLGTPIDLSKVTSDAFLVAGLRDHITTWRPCYMTSQLLGGDTEVVIVNSGHIQSFVNPVGRSEYKYWWGLAGGPGPGRRSPRRTGWEATGTVPSSRRPAAMSTKSNRNRTLPISGNRPMGIMLPPKIPRTGSGRPLGAVVVCRPEEP